MTVTAPDRGQVPAMTTLDLVRFGASMLYMAPGEALGRVQDRHNAPAVRLPGWTAPLPMILGLRQVLLSADPAFAECVALNQEHTLSNASGWGPALARFGMFTRSLLQMDFDEHRYDRLLMQQAMTPERLTSYLDQVAPKFRDAVRGLPTGDGVDMRKLFKRTNMRLVIEVFMGINLPPEEVDKVGKAFDDLVSVNTLRQTLARRYLHRFLLSWVPAKRAAHTPDLMSEMCHARALDGAAYSDKQIMHHMMFFLFAAHDTTTITMTNMAYYLALNPHWQRRARAQAFEFPEDATRADFDKMTELQNIMKETLRFRTPVPLLIRASILDTDILGYRVPRKTGILALTWGHHTNPAIWSEPRRFDPDRFSPERAEDKDHRSKWMPFGGGVHKCIGMHFAKMQIFTVYHTLLREFTWSVDRDYVLPTLANSLAFSNGFPATVRRFDPASDGGTHEFPEDQAVGWGVAPNLRPLMYLRSRRRRREDVARSLAHGMG
ncbi:cytochrome P450 [Mycobacteroides abscessus]|nr:cytochrome P450 [Mycobacteroides abscessus]MDM1890221.1 cytochrome P450 [Mycobacteroides abscessus]